ncbi:MAG: sulfotransferase family protein [Pseudomonadota bacterium]
MSLQVIGAGFGRTGTLSLKYALEQLGVGPCYHMMEIRQHPHHIDEWAAIQRGATPDWETLLSGYASAVDWPSCNFWASQLAWRPQAKVILSLRDGEAWHRSVMNTIYPSTLKGRSSDDPAVRRHTAAIDEIIWNGVFDGRIEDAAHAIACFDAHNRAVMDAVPAEQLLVYRPGDGWEPLCAFLEVPVPDAPYPRVNSTEDFQKLWSRD